MTAIISDIKAFKSFCIKSANSITVIDLNLSNLPDHSVEHVVKHIFSTTGELTFNRIYRRPIGVLCFSHDRYYHDFHLLTRILYFRVSLSQRLLDIWSLCVRERRASQTCNYALLCLRKHYSYDPTRSLGKSIRSTVDHNQFRCKHAYPSYFLLIFPQLNWTATNS